jgi:hypothetical protein
MASRDAGSAGARRHGKHLQHSARDPGSDEVILVPAALRDHLLTRRRDDALV